MYCYRSLTAFLRQLNCISSSTPSLHESHLGIGLETASIHHKRSIGKHANIYEYRTLSALCTSHVRNTWSVEPRVLGNKSKLNPASLIFERVHSLTDCVIHVRGTSDLQALWTRSDVRFYHTYTL